MGKTWFGCDFRSQQQREQDTALYERWAFPHGAPQREAVCAQLDRLLSRIHKEERLYVYLMLRQAYWGTDTFGVPCAADEAATLRKAREIAPPLHAHEARAVLALVRHDATVGETLDYNACDEPLRSR